MKLTEAQMKGYKPTDSHVLVKDCPLPVSKTLASTEYHQDPFQRAKVIAIGDRCHYVKPGDIVHYPLARSCQECFPEGYANLAEESILGVEESEPVTILSTKRSSLDRKEYGDDTVKFLKDINMGKMMDEKKYPNRKKVVVDMGKNYTY